MGKRQEEAKQTRKKIIDTVKINLGQDNHDFTVDEITKEAGVSKGTFYTYFKSKEEAIFEVTNEAFFNISDNLLSENTTYERLKTFLIKSAEVIKDSGLETAKNWMKYAVCPTDEKNKGINKYNYDFNIIKTCLIDGIKEKELIPETPVHELTEIIICQYYGTVAIWCLTNGRENISDIMENYCNTALKEMLTPYKL